mgnify:CR=1 FL=1
MKSQEFLNAHEALVNALKGEGIYQTTAKIPHPTEEGLFICFANQKNEKYKSFHVGAGKKGRTSTNRAPNEVEIQHFFSELRKMTESRGPKNKGPSRIQYEQEAASSMINAVKILAASKNKVEGATKEEENPKNQVKASKKVKNMKESNTYTAS